VTALDKLARVLRITRRAPALDEDFFRSSEIIQKVSALEGSDDAKLEYLKQMITLAQDDAKIVSWYLAGAVVANTLLLPRILPTDVAHLSNWIKIPLLTGIISLALSALCLFSYMRRVHYTRMALVRCIPSLDVLRARELWGGAAGVWRKYGRVHNAGTTLLIIGGVLEGVSVAVSFFS
jgi:hypothetical protein